MVKEGKNELIEGVNYLIGYDNEYNPEKKSLKNRYSFEFIYKAFNYYKLSRHVEKIIAIIIFDSIIGNGDRHQENWGFVTEYNDVIQGVIEKPKMNYIDQLFFHLRALINKKGKNDYKVLVREYGMRKMVCEFAPIYDSGSCLGRENTDEKMSQMMNDPQMINAYINRGKSEIHWEGEKINHFELIRKVGIVYSEFVEKYLNQVESRYNEDEIKQIIYNIDNSLPVGKKKFMLPLERKEFISKLITLRVERLMRINK